MIKLEFKFQIFTVKKKFTFWHSNIFPKNVLPFHNFLKKANGMGTENVYFWFPHTFLKQENFKHSYIKKINLWVFSEHFCTQQWFFVAKMHTLFQLSIMCKILLSFCWLKCFINSYYQKQGELLSKARGRVLKNFFLQLTI